VNLRRYFVEDLFVSRHVAPKRAAIVNASLKIVRLFGHTARNWARRSLIITVKK